MKLLKGRTAIITGGSRGIGKACCLAFAREGASIVFTYNKSKKEADALAVAVRKAGVKCLSLKADVRNLQQCRTIVEKTLRQFGKYDIVVNNAGVTSDKPLFMMTEEDWRIVLDTNLTGTFNMCRAAVTTLLKQKTGTIINMSSVSGLIGLAGQTNYSASKAGVIGFSKALAKEAAPCGVNVNVVAPGFIATDMVNKASEEMKKKFQESVPMKRFGSAEEVAELCVFLASDKAKYITGDVIKIDGGLAI